MAKFRILGVTGALLTIGLLLSGCSSAPAPKPTPTSTAKAPEVVRPAYDTQAANKPAFTINGTGTEKIKINLPAGFKEPTIITLSSTGQASLKELNFDNAETSQVASIGTSAGGTDTEIKYPTANTPARTSNFNVDAAPGVSWAVSAEALASVPVLSATSIAGTTSRMFLLNADANTVDFITIGNGASHLELIPLFGTAPISIATGSDSGEEEATAPALSPNLKSFAGYIFVLTASNPDTQGWQILFSQQVLSQ